GGVLAGRGGLRGPAPGGGDGRGGGGRMWRRAEPVNCSGGGRGPPARGGAAWAARHDPPQHLDEEARQREVRPFCIGGRVHEHDPTLPPLLGGGERRAARAPRPRLICESGSGVGGAPPRPPNNRPDGGGGGTGPGGQRER